MTRLPDTPEQALREFFAERHRRENPPSLAGIDPDTPRSTAPSDGRWEQLCWLTRGCPEGGLEVLYDGFARWGAPVWKAAQPGNRALGGDWLSSPVRRGELAARWGITTGMLARLRGAVLAAIAENLGRAREKRRGEASHELRALALRSLGGKR